MILYPLEINESYLHVKYGPSRMKNEGVIPKILGNIQICRESLYMGYIAPDVHLQQLN